MQRKHERNDVYRKIASFEEQATLKRGTVVDRPYRSSVFVKNLGADGAYSTQALTDTSETLTINVEKEASFYIREIDEIQSNYETANEYADDMAVKVGNFIDGDVLGEYDQATSIVDDADFGGTSGNGVTVTSSNVAKLFALAKRKMRRLNVLSRGEMWAVISGELEQTLNEYLVGKQSNLGDKVSDNGFIGRFYGFNLYGSNSVGWSGKLLIGTTPTNNDTVVINGVTFTFVTSIGSTAGNVLINGATGSVTNLVTAINNPDTTDANQVKLSAANQAKMVGVVATDNTTNLTIKAEGWGYLAVSETLTASADIWTAAVQIQHNLFGVGKPTDIVIQKFPNMVIKDVSGKLGKDVVTWTVYGLKTFTEGKDMMVDVKVRSDAF